jgi:hypothetical protein
MSLVRYRPIIKNKEADMAVDVSGAWTSLTCYYTLHDKIVTLQAENERLRKAGDAMADALKCSGCSECEGMYDSHEKALDAWLYAKGVQS